MTRNYHEVWLDRWAENDDPPGQLTWEEWEAETGLDSEALKQLAPEISHASIRHLYSERAVYLHCDAAWVQSIENYELDRSKASEQAVAAANTLIDWLIDQDTFSEKEKFLDVVNGIRAHVEIELESKTTN